MESDRVRKEVNEIMGGKILEYKAKTIFKEGIQTGIQTGIETGSMHCYLNALARGLSHEDAIAIADITEETAAKALSLRKEGKL